jgi:hypothetical protein
MKTLMYLLYLFIASNYSYLFSQPSTIDAELIIVNYTNLVDPYVRISPVGTVFNGDNNTAQGRTGKYRFEPRWGNLKVYGGISNNWFIATGGEKVIYLNNDATVYNPNNPIRMAIGYGKYLVEFMHYVGEGEFVRIGPEAYCYVDFSDGNYPYNNSFINDIFINLRISSGYYINFSFSGGSLKELSDIPEQDRTIKIWHQLGLNNNQYRAPSKGLFYSDNTGNNHLYPLTAPNNLNGIPFIHTSPDNCGLNLLIAGSHHSYIEIGNKQFNVSNSTLSNPTILTINPSAILTANSNSELKFGNYSKGFIENTGLLELLNNSVLRLLPGSELRVRSGGSLCSYGATIRGRANIRWEGGLHSSCIYEDWMVIDSTQLILEDSATVEFPDSSIVTLDSNASLICKPYSTIKFGEGSKLILKHGSKLIANNCTFTSLVAGETWDGIYSYDLSNDTITNCTFENAVNGINLIDKSTTSIGATNSVEISSCTFKNSSTTELTNGVYISNSEKILLRSNNFTSTQLVIGFTSAVLCEYSNTTVNVLDNTFSNIRNGVTAVYSSMNLARNTFNGQSATSEGLYLDNSSGTIEYNIFNNFINSITCSYSSPYVLSNTMNSFSGNAIKMDYQSNLLMKPVNSSSAITWLGGRNKFNGSPSDAGITIAGDSYPAVDSGYNKFLITGDDIEGTYSGSSYNARLNYWTNSTPVINIGIGNVTTDPTWDGTSYP